MYGVECWTPRAVLVQWTAAIPTYRRRVNVYRYLRVFGETVEREAIGESGGNYRFKASRSSISRSISSFGPKFLLD